MEDEEEVEQEEAECPAVIVEEVPSAQVEQCYAAQVLVYDDETYLMQGVAEEQEVVTEVVETGESGWEYGQCSSGTDWFWNRQCGIIEDLTDSCLDDDEY